MAQNFAHRDYSHTQKKTGGSGGGARTSRDRARRELSQNFLVDARAVDLVVRTARPSGLVLEPGAGEGALTRALVRHASHVTAYEIDPLLALKLKAGGFDVVRGDFTKARPPREPFAVVGNIPYSITSRIVDWCLRAPTLTSATLLPQREYARKRSGDYGRWSKVTVETWPWFTWRLGATISRTSFRPVPSVDSSILRLERRETPLLPDPTGWQELVDLGFTGVGGSLRASLKTRHTHVDAALHRAGLNHNTLVGHVHPDQWITLFRCLR
ncbi:ErmE/ErmH/ErmO/ErmR family 23S rRNA (adenine(2058)-N(6))-methyltransferase [Streptomyces durbertensis]|uniref:ErmE/ErmH/ErmO/ErmR family 23S rRNA (Adenine(2058)-N(6))-methyltransferase n=1 Tax=Streptomyces durbertensis TaxID=2448886 RepID=A0ABR6EN63_9ACTN|nr:ErmE/ErmH/ErmO/ErmR family 23S rRNA (adenine(2058)-N(6))-methyltransferase [Streptomyces durbertensis]MBB1246790.1 ErmE/ErmH/ErmO/ErmR family 23S rRNA (adenine(2058)-N(6))-methyltransferase [Streptomyces durbertensis]